jgi:hypothetical protein
MIIHQRPSWPEIVADYYSSPEEVRTAMNVKVRINESKSYAVCAEGERQQTMLIATSIRSPGTVTD